MQIQIGNSQTLYAQAGTAHARTVYGFSKGLQASSKSFEETFNGLKEDILEGAAVLAR